MNTAFTHSQYVVHKKAASITSTKLYIYDKNEQLVLYSQVHALKQIKNISLYSDESMQTEVLRIHARNVLELSATFDVQDSETGEHVGALRRKSLKSYVLDEWVILDHQDQEITLIKKDTTMLMKFLRFIPLIPQKYSIEITGTTIPAFKENFNPLFSKLITDFSTDAKGVLDHRLGLVAAVLLSANQGRQKLKVLSAYVQ